MANRAYSRAGIIARLFNQPLAVMPDTAAIVLGAIGQRFDVQQLFVATDGRQLSLGELEGMAAQRRGEIVAAGGIDRRGAGIAAERLMFVNAGVAHVIVRGETVAENDGAIGPMSGFTGYDGLLAAVRAADADPNVRGILLDVDSPGGEVSGMFEAGNALLARRGIKPMRALIRNCGCSAAYALAACADEITLHEMGMAGSIGALMLHADFSAALEASGVKVTQFASGGHKTDGNKFEPLSAGVAAKFQAMVDAAGTRFIEHVAKARGLNADAVRAQQAQIYHGGEAVSAGLVDKVMGWQDSMDEFEAAVNGMGKRPAATAPSGARSAKGTSMSIEATAPAADQPEFTKAQLDAAVASAATSASAAAVTGERERIAALAELDAASSVSPALASAIADGTSAGDFAIGLARASKAAAGAALTGLQADAVKPGDLPVADAATAQGGAQAPVNRGAAAVERLRGKVPHLPGK